MKMLRFGMIGGAPGSFIGDVHRRGAQMDDMAVLSAGCFSRNEEKNRITGESWHVPEDRLYADWEQMAEAEASRPDGIDFIVIATPNRTHYPIAKCFLEHGIHVSCDKPVAMSTAEALELRALAQKKGLHFGVSYTYVNYPMVHQMREMIEAGEIGRILTVVAEYPQDWVANALAAGEDVKHKWRFDPAQAGESACNADIGTHLTCLIHMGTGLQIEHVLANLRRLPADMPLDTNSQVMLKLTGDVPGLLWASQVAIGHECTVSLRVFGDKGALEWNHDQPTRLKFNRANGPEIYLTNGRDFLSDRARGMSRIAAGHPEGFFEAFGNYYRAFCREVLRLMGETDEPSLPHPTIDEGIQSMQFVDACVQSNREGNIWIAVPS
ncbi:MAG: Gfo/Idh/MocA family protein [Butyricicoccaceae bacterium]